MPRVCSIDGCGRNYRSKGYCDLHYSRLRRLGSVGDAEPLHMSRAGQCEADGCSAPIRSRRLCERHYSRLIKTGQIEDKVQEPKHCNVDACDRDYYAKGHCRLHYRRLRRTGTTDARQEAPKTTCRIEECFDVAKSKGLCNKHYKRFRTHGDPLVSMQGMPTPVFNRFVNMFTRGEDDECWPWEGSIGTHGYGIITECRAGVTRQLRASRVAYEFFRRPIPDGMMICHTCDNPICVNPRHLYAGTHQDNADDRWSSEPVPRMNPELAA